MFEKIVADMQNKIDSEQRKIILEYIQKIMNSGFIFVESKIAKDVSMICNNGTNEELLDLYELLSELQVDCKGYLISLDIASGGKTEEYFNDYIKEKGLKSAKDEIHKELADLISEINN